MQRQYVIIAVWPSMDLDVMPIPASPRLMALWICDCQQTGSLADLLRVVVGPRRQFGGVDLGFLARQFAVYSLRRRGFGRREVGLAFVEALGKIRSLAASGAPECSCSSSIVLMMRRIGLGRR